MKKLLLTAVLVGVLVTPAWAITVTDTTVGRTVCVTEPTTNANGTPLTDLATIRFYVDEIGDGSSKDLAAEVPASSPTGGQQACADVINAIRDGEEYVVDYSATAVDDPPFNRESAESAKERRDVDGLAPGAPQ